MLSVPSQSCRQDMLFTFNAHEITKLEMIRAKRSFVKKKTG